MIKAIRQQTTAGGAFDGTLPATTPADPSNKGIADYPAAATGGLFDPASAVPMWIERFAWHSSVATTWTLSIVSTDGTTTWSTVLFANITGATETDAVSSPADRVYLHPGEKLKLAAAPGGGALMMAEVTFHDRLID